ncbi:MAG: maleylacetoacetate isomerase [Novosphingobium sp.]|nr:maleylacetoacetate isomerase [Novosphingobium sp.]
MTETVFYDYWRSSAAYRVRIVLQLKGIAYRTEQVDLGAGEQTGARYRELNPQGLIPALAIDGHLITQSLAIIDYLDITRGGPAMLPDDPAARAHTLAQALIVAADIHPLNNLRVQLWLRDELGADQSTRQRWMAQWMTTGFAALEAQAPEQGLFGGSVPNLADVCLVPQLYNARRFDIAVDAFPRLLRIDAEARAHPAVAAAAPEAAKPA